MYSGLIAPSQATTRGHKVKFGLLKLCNKHTTISRKVSFVTPVPLAVIFNGPRRYVGHIGRSYPTFTPSSTKRKRENGFIWKRHVFLCFAVLLCFWDVCIICWSFGIACLRLLCFSLTLPMYCEVFGTGGGSFLCMAFWHGCEHTSPIIHHHPKDWHGCRWHEHDL